MPNWVTVRITADRTEPIHALLDENGVTFKRIIPPPDTDNYNSPSCSHMGLAGNHPPDCWYRWNAEHWGCKWDASDSEVDDDNLGVRFETPWAHPQPVLAVLSEKFPTDAIRVAYADENTGHNVGKYILLAGRLIADDSPDEGSIEAAEMATQIRYGQTLKQYLQECYTPEELNECYDEEYLQAAGVLEKKGD